MLQLNTSGNGYWSEKQAAVTITDIVLSWTTDEQDFGELKVYFNTADWNVETDGLIYSDEQFMDELKMYCWDKYGSDDIGYSEQGLQGDNYVSCDVGEEFISRYKELHATV